MYSKYSQPTRTHKTILIPTETYQTHAGITTSTSFIYIMKMTVPVDANNVLIYANDLYSVWCILQHRYKRTQNSPENRQSGLEVFVSSCPHLNIKLNLRYYKLTAEFGRKRCNYNTIVLSDRYRSNMATMSSDNYKIYFLHHSTRYRPGQRNSTFRIFPTGILR